MITVTQTSKAYLSINVAFVYNLIIFLCKSVRGDAFAVLVSIYSISINTIYTINAMYTVNIYIVHHILHIV